MAGCLWNTEPVKKPLVSVMITLLENMGVEDRTEILGGESQYVCAKSLQLCLTFCNPMDCRLPGSSVNGIFQARIWSGLLFPSLGDLPDLGIEPTTLTTSVLRADSVLLSHCGSRLSSS